MLGKFELAGLEGSVIRYCQGPGFLVWTLEHWDWEENKVRFGPQLINPQSSYDRSDGATCCCKGMEGMYCTRATHTFGIVQVH